MFLFNNWYTFNYTNSPTERESESERESVCVCVCVCVCVRVSVRERERVCVCVCQKHWNRTRLSLNITDSLCRNSAWSYTTQTSYEKLYSIWQTELKTWKWFFEPCCFSCRRSRTVTSTNSASFIGRKESVSVSICTLHSPPFVETEVNSQDNFSHVFLIDRGQWLSAGMRKLG